MKYLLFFLYFFFFFHTYGQKLNIRDFKIEDGLSGDKCIKTATDKYGQLWIATQEHGLNIFNGYEFEYVNQEKGLISNRIIDFVIDKNNVVCILTEKGLSLYDGAVFRNYFISDKISLIQSIALSKEGSLWFYHKKKGIGYFKNTIDKQPQYLNNGVLKGKEINKICILNEENIFLSTDDGELFLRTENTFRLIDLSEFSISKIYSFYRYSKNLLWLGSDKGCFSIDILNLKIHKVPFYFRKETLHNFICYSIAEDIHKNLWIATNLGVIYKETGVEDRLFTEKNGFSLQTKHINIDHEGGVWMSYYDGIRRLSPINIFFYGEEQGLSSSSIVSMTADGDNNFWILTKNGIDILPTNHQLYSLLDTIPKNYNRNRLKNYLQKGGKLIANKEKKEIHWIHSQAHIKISQEKKITIQEIDMGEVYDAKMGKDGIVWIATNKGLVKNENDNYTIVLDKNILGGSCVTLSVDKDKIWVLNATGDIFLYDFQEIKKIEKNENIHCQNINTIFLDSKSSFWVCCEESRLYRVKEDNQWLSFEDLPILTNITTLIGNENILWMGTKRGINKLDILKNDDFHITSFGKQEGINYVKIQKNGLALNRSGRLAAVVSQGVYIIDNQIYKANFSKKIVLKEIKTKEQIMTSEDIKKFNKTADLPTISIQKTTNYLKIKFSSVEFDIPNKIVYQTKLKNFDQNWSLPSTSREVIYPSLPGGIYTLQIRVCKESECFTYDVAKLDIKNPFYQTNRFYFLCFLVIAIISYLYIKSRIKKENNNKYLLQKNVQENTQRVKRQKTILEQQQNRLQKILHANKIQNEKLASINQHLKESMEYAVKIQNKLLSSEKDLKKEFVNSFVFSLSIDIVKSDFFWIGKNMNQNFCYLIIGDCSESGIVGAFLSIIGNDVIHDLIGSNRLYTPSELLQSINFRIENILTNSKEKTQEKVEFAVIRFNKKESKMLIATQNIPIYYFSKEKSEVVGNIYEENDEKYADLYLKKYKDKEIKITEDTFIYSFSKGFFVLMDLNKDKLKIEKGKKILKEIQKSPFDSHKGQLKTLCNKWIKNSTNKKQIEDIFALAIHFKDCKKN